MWQERASADGASGAEAALRRSEQRLRLAIDAGRMAVWEVDIANDRLLGTPELNRLLGFPEDAELDIDEVRAGYYPGERERVQAIGQQVIASGGRFIETEYRYVRPDGAERWLMLRAEMLYGEDGAPARAVGVLMDITARKATEGALRTSEARLKIALKAAGAGVFEWNVATGWLDWSAEVYALYGIDPSVTGERLHAAWTAAVHPDDVAEAQAIGQRAATLGESFTVDFRIVRPDGALRWLRSHGTVVMNAQGSPARVTGINIDVTAEHQDQERLRARAEETERERDRIYELSNDLFAVAGFDGYLKVINPAWERMLGHDRETLLARPFMDILHPDDIESAAAIIAELRAGKEVQHFEDRLRRADGKYIWLSWSAVSGGDRFYAVGRDVTLEKEREEALRQAQKMEAVGHLTGGIAHDFNNLLQAVHGNFDLIRRRTDDERLKRWAEQGLQAADRGARLTAQLLAFSRAQKLELRPVALAPLLAEMEDMLSRTLGPMVRIQLDLGDDESAVIADPTQLEMAVLNLAINARDAMPEGGTLAIRTRRCAAPGGTAPGLPPGAYAAIEVADDGTGMPPEVAARAFDPFFTTKQVGKGTGLGLSQVYGMARQAGGTALLRSAPGEGTSVTIILRRTDAAGPEADERRPETRLAAPRSSTILVVDDDPDVRGFLVDSLSGLGYRVVEAEGGEEGLNRLDAAAPDLMLVDYAMPGMSGAELADQVRLRRPGLPIVFASGYADTAAIEAAAGPSALLLRKPFRIDELHSVIAAALAGRAQAPRS